MPHSVNTTSVMVLLSSCIAARYLRSSYWKKARLLPHSNDPIPILVNIVDCQHYQLILS